MSKISFFDTKKAHQISNLNFLDIKKVKHFESKLLRKNFYKILLWNINGVCQNLPILPSYLFFFISSFDFFSTSQIVYETMQANLNSSSLKFLAKLQPYPHQSIFACRSMFSPFLLSHIRIFMQAIIFLYQICKHVHRHTFILTPHLYGVVQ